jgi:serine/threonine protein kinase
MKDKGAIHSMSGEQFQKMYKYEKELGKGSSGYVFEAVYLPKEIDGETKRNRVAIKRVPIDEKEFFIREICVLDTLQKLGGGHAKIAVKKYDAIHVHTQGTQLHAMPGFYLIMELGAFTLRTLISSKFMEVKEAVRIIREILCRLSLLEQMGRIHGDLKPENIVFLNTDCASMRFIDWSGCTRLSDEGTRADIFTTIWYRAPEVFMRVRTITRARVDVWATACCFYEVLTGGALMHGIYCQLPAMRRLVSCFGMPPYHMFTQSNPGVDLREGAPHIWTQSLFRPVKGSLEIVFGATFTEEEQRLLQPCIADMFKMDPSRRPSATRLLQMPLFALPPKSPVGVIDCPPGVS